MVDESKVVATLINPEDDGVTHINVYSRSKCELGRKLSNFSHIPLNHPQYGRFASMEGYWYWVATGMKEGGPYDDLRLAYGYAAKNIGAKLERVQLEPYEFQQLILEGHIYRILQNQDLHGAFVLSSLPFRHYYVYGKADKGVKQMVIDQSGKHYWQIEALEQLRTHLQTSGNPDYVWPEFFQGRPLEILRDWQRSSEMAKDFLGEIVRVID